MKVKSRNTLHPNNLPTPLSTFIGRKRELTELTYWLSMNRLVTLSGAGGSSKTRLALRVAEELLRGFDHSLWLVEPASILDPQLVSQTIASSLDIQEVSGLEYPR